jgi:undecaprenyl-diphosphatase
MTLLVSSPSSVRGRRADAWTAGAGLAVLAAGLPIVRDGEVPEWERRTFRAINGLPDALYPVVWPIQQFGALAAGGALAVVAIVLRRRRLAVAAVLATVGKLGLERAVKAIVTRHRPGTTIGADIETRGAVSIRGESFVSGHALLATALAALVAPHLPRRLRWIPFVVAAGVLFGRVYVGAHNPLDVVCGAGLGLALAALLNATVNTRASASREADVGGPESGGATASVRSRS